MYHSPIVKVYRYWQDTNQTFGNAVVFDRSGKPVFSSVAIERGWRNNKKGESCVPPGEYVIKFEYSPAFKRDLWELYGVEGRSECKFHPANNWRQLNGCIALGIKLKDIDNDGYIDVTYSKDTIDSFHTALSGYKEAIVIIKDLL